MPVAGLRVGDVVRSPNGMTGIVARVFRQGGREHVQVEMTNGALGVKTFPTASVRLLKRPRLGPEGAFYGTRRGE
jgi:hypothetical protein